MGPDLQIANLNDAEPLRARYEVGMDLQKEILDLKRRLDVVETQLSHVDGFQIVVGQLRDLQLYLHTKFADLDRQFGRLGGSFDDLVTKVGGIETSVADLKVSLEALPRLLADVIAHRLK